MWWERISNWLKAARASKATLKTTEPGGLYASYAGRNETQARSVLRTLGQSHREVFDAVSDRWPSPLAHEIRRLQEELAEGTVITVQWQLTDCYELIMKFVCLALASDLLQVGDDSLNRDVRRGLLRSLSGGAWLGLWRDLCKRAGAQREELKLPELIDEGRFWVGEGKGKFCIAFAKLIAHRNNTKGHGALGYDQLEQVQSFLGLVDALAQCARDGLHHFDDLMLFGEDLKQPWSGWQTIRTRHDADCRIHTEDIAPLYLRRGDGEGAMDLALSPLIAQRQCGHCGRRDVFMFDSFDGRGDRARFYLNDYLAGHRMSPEVSDVPDFHPLMNGLDLADLSDTEAPTDDAISSDFLQWLEDSLEQARYLAPEYLFNPVREYLQTHDHGVVLLTAPAMVGKSVFSAHLEGALRDKPPEHGRYGRWVVKHFAIRRGLTGLSLDHFDNYLDHDVLRTPRSEGGLGIQPANNPTSLSALHALMCEGGAEVSWPQVFAQRLRELMARVRNETVSVVLVIDGLDELPAESAERGLGACLDAPALSEALPEGCYLVLTARPADECGPMSGVVKRLQAQADAAGLHLQIEPQQIIENAAEAAPLSRAYLSLLEKLYDKRIASKKVGVGLDHKTLLPILLERSLGRFGYMDHIVQLFEEGIVQAEDVAGLPKGERLYSHYLEELRRQLDPDLDAKGAPPRPGRTHTRNRWQELVGVLCLLAAEERAFNAELKEIGDFYPGLRFEGLSLDLLARALHLPRPTYALIKQLVQIRPLLSTHRLGRETYSSVGIGTRDLLETLVQSEAYAEPIGAAHQILYRVHWAQAETLLDGEANAPIKEESLPGLCRASWHRSMTGKLSPAQAEQDQRMLVLTHLEKEEKCSLVDGLRLICASRVQVRPTTIEDVMSDGFRGLSHFGNELLSDLLISRLKGGDFALRVISELSRLISNLWALRSLLTSNCLAGADFLEAELRVDRARINSKSDRYGIDSAIRDYDDSIRLYGGLLKRSGDFFRDFEFVFYLACCYSQTCYSCALLLLNLTKFRPVQAKRNLRSGIIETDGVVSSVPDGFDSVWYSELNRIRGKINSLLSDACFFDFSAAVYSDPMFWGEEWCSVIPGLDSFDWSGWCESQAPEFVNINQFVLDALLSGCPWIGGLSGEYSVLACRPIYFIGAALIEVRHILPNGTLRFLRLVVSPPFFVHLDGTEFPIEWLFWRGVVKTETEESAANYARFYLQNIGSAGGAYYVVESESDVELVLFPSDLLQKEIISYLRPLEVSARGGGCYDGLVFVIIGYSLYRLEFDLNCEMVRFLREVELLSRLPWKKRKRYMDGWVINDDPFDFAGCLYGKDIALGISG